jgi:hypothetical protein
MARSRGLGDVYKRQEYFFLSIFLLGLLMTWAVVNHPNSEAVIASLSQAAQELCSESAK